MAKKNSQLTIYDIGGKIGTIPGHFGGEMGTERSFDLLRLKTGNNVLEVCCGIGCKWTLDRSLKTYPPSLF